MRRSRTILVLALALICGLLAAYLVVRLLEQQATPLLASEPPAAEQVVVAARNLPIGAYIGEQDVKVVAWPGREVPVGYARNIPDVVGRGVITPVIMNEPILEGRLADRTSGGGLAITVPEGMRGFSVRVDQVIAVAGFVRPGTRVDVLLTIAPSGQSETITKSVLQNVEVLAADQITERDPKGEPVTATVLTVLVTPEDAEKLALASSQGRIQLALRNPIDVREARTSGARVAQLLSGSSAPATGGGARRAAPAPAPEATTSAGTVEVIKGANRAIIRF